ncbi:MAG: Hsp20/alpha crystallin family protein [Patescibacteria group bacterium]
MKIIKRNNRVPQFNPMRSMLDDFFAFPSMLDEMLESSYTSKNISVDIWEEDDKYFVKMAIPGVAKEDINITINADYITIKGSTKKEEKEDDKKKYYYKTLETAFEQTFNLPAKVDSDNADAKYENGVLTLTLPKASDVKPKTLEVK